MPPAAGLTQLQAILVRLIEVSVGLAFVALVVVITWAGIRYLVSGGDAKGLQAATQTLTWGVVGMVFLVLAWLILKLIEAFTGVPVTTFCLGFKPYCV